MLSVLIKSLYRKNDDIAGLGQAGSRRNMFVQTEGQDVGPLGCEAVSF